MRQSDWARRSFVIASRRLSPPHGYEFRYEFSTTSGSKSSLRSSKIQIGPWFLHLIYPVSPVGWMPWNPWAGTNYSASNPHHMELKNLYKPVLGGNHWNPAWGHIWQHVCKLVPMGSVLAIFKCGEQNCLGPIVQQTGVMLCACPFRHSDCVFALIESDPISRIHAEDADHSKLFGRVLTFQASGSLSWKLRSYNVTNVTMKWLVSGPRNLQQSNMAMENHHGLVRNSSTHQLIYLGTL